ncbi:MAG: phage tail tape measure protein [Phycisphaerae bacterium]|jgi:TP901 family phage tail tape measure protein
MAEDTKVLEVVLELRDLMTAKLKTGAAQAGKTNTAFAALTKTVTRLYAAYIGFQGIKSAINMIVEFDVAMRNVNSIMRVGEKEFRQWSKAIIDLSRIVPQSADVLAKGLYEIASSGFEGADAFNVLKASAKAASAGLTSTNIAVKAIAGSLNAFGTSAYTADEVADILFKTVDKGVITFEELASTIGMVNSSAAMVGVPLEQVGAAIAEMTKKGLEAPIAMTGLSNLLRATIAPSDKMAAAIKRFGYESGEALLKAKGLPGLLKLLQEATGGSAGKLAELIPEIRGTRAAAALLSGEQGLAGTIKAMDAFTDSTGATQRALDEQKKSIKFVYELIKNNFKAALLDTANLTLPSVTDATQDNAKAWADWGYSVGKVVGEVGLLAAQMANAIRAVFDTLMLVVTSVVGGIASAIAGVGRLLERMSGRLFDWVGTAQGVADASLGAIGSYNAGTGYAGGIGNASDLAKDLYKRQKALMGMGASTDMSALGAGRSGIPGAGDSTGTGTGAGYGEATGVAKALMQEMVKFTNSNASASYSKLTPDVQKLMAAFAQAFKDATGQKLDVTSTYRSPSVNKAVGGVPNSLHLTGRAFDIPGSSLRALAAKLGGISEALKYLDAAASSAGGSLLVEGQYSGIAKSLGIRSRKAGAGLHVDMRTAPETAVDEFKTATIEATSALYQLAAQAGMERYIASGVGLGGNAGGMRPFENEEYARVKEYWDNASAEARQRYIDSGVGPGGNAGSEGILFPTPGYTGEDATRRNRTGFAQLTSNDFLMNAAAAGIGTLASGGGGRELAAGLLPMIGSAFGPIGAAVGGLLGGLFGKKKQQQPVTEAIPVKIVNLADMATAFLSATQSRRMMATAPGMQRLTTQLNMQAAQVGVV